MSSNPMDNGYITVAERHAQFVKDHPNGLIHTEVEHFVFDPQTGKGFVTVKAIVYKDGKAANFEVADGTGNASMPIPGPTNFTKNSEVENAETSAVGRALAMIGYHPKETFASSEEIQGKKGEAEANTNGRGPTAASAAQVRRMFVKAKEAGYALDTEAGKKALQDSVFEWTGKRSSSQLEKGDMDKIFDGLEKVRQIVAMADAVPA